MTCTTDDLVFRYVRNRGRVDITYGTQRGTGLGLKQRGLPVDFLGGVKNLVVKRGGTTITNPGLRSSETNNVPT